MEYELDTKSCAQVALYMYQQYKEFYNKPSFMVLSFEDWLAKLIEKN